MQNVAILLTVFNRKITTLNGLSTLYKQINLHKDIHFDVYMTDDGCTDGTPEAVSQEFPQINIVKGDGTLFWSGGMRAAWDAAMAKGTYDYYLWFNDDAILYDNAFQILFDANKDLGDNTIVSGAFCNADTGKTSYGGWSKSFSFVELNPNRYEPVYFMNGNLVLIPNRVFQSIGNIDKHYIHGLGDWDYSGRAIKKGYNVVIAKQFVGTTSRHDTPVSSAYRKDKNIVQRLKTLYSPIFHPKIKWHFKKTHFGLFSAIVAIVACHAFAIFPAIAKKNTVVE